MPRLLIFLAIVGFLSILLPLLIRTGIAAVFGLRRLLTVVVFFLILGRARSTARQALGARWREWFSEIWGSEGGGWGPEWASRNYQSAFLVSLFSMLGKLTKADGRVAESEIQAIERLMDVELRLSPQRRQQARDIFRHAKESIQSFEQYAEDFYRLFGRSPEMPRLMYSLLEQVALADGAIVPEEAQLLDAARRIFHLAASRQQEARFAESRGARSMDQYLAVLGLKPGASLKEIKKAYRKLVLECHPDRMIAQGVPPQLRARTEARFKEVQHAYEELSRVVS